MSKNKKNSTKETDGAYVLKLVLYVIIGAQWVFLETKTGTNIPLPIGVFIGSFFALHDHFQVDRKIEYAVLLSAMLIGFFAQVGLFVQL